MLRTSSDRAVEAIHSRLQDLQGIVVGEHNGLRSYIGRLRPFSGAPHSRLERFPLQLEALAERIERQWGMTVTLRVEGACETLLPVPLQSEVYLIAREALVNAARHAQSSR
jgi:signal transduction histidine kinase